MLQNYEYLYDACFECKEAIYNPLCPRCLSREIEAWLENKPEIRKAIKEELKEILGRERPANSEFLECQGCISCRNKRVFLCPYCFTELVYKKLKKEKAGKGILKEFLTFFNFDFEHTGYTKDMEKLGLI